jgi:tartrate-resistant acid phosphatase type 5
MLKPILRLLPLLALLPTCSAPPASPGQPSDPPALPDGGGGGKVVAPEPGTKPVGVDSPVRFAVLGDTGKGNDGQRAVAAALARKCAQSGCDFVVSVGDNIYDSGVASADDEQFKTLFEDVYKDINLPFWMVLGNHDYGLHGAGFNFWRGQYQVDYTTRSTKWKMPSQYYKFGVTGIDFLVLDTNMQMYSLDRRQRADVREWLSTSNATWKLAFGHHPYLSNGPHGNAGRYDGLPGLPIWDGTGVLEFFDDEICGKTDLYISGHDHSRQWLTASCNGTELAVSGASAQVSNLPGANPVRFQAATLGLMWIEIKGKTLTAEFIDVDGKVEFTRTLNKP